MLWATAHVKEFNSCRWMTFKQALELGGVREEGRKGHKVSFLWLD